MTGVQPILGKTHLDPSKTLTAGPTTGSAQKRKASGSSASGKRRCPRFAEHSVQYSGEEEGKQRHNACVWARCKFG